MKIQDILFLIILAVLVWKKSSKLATAAGLISLFASIPLFFLWVFFSAERLTWYAAGFFVLAIIFAILKLRTEK
ncbi:MAG TPA: hypothetical protein VLF68_01515 [Candidatus Saccharimonadales bacterium]|nr:hypothetical protein [Candidatus Saccharimonadales bacterium]